MRGKAGHLQTSICNQDNNRQHYQMGKITTDSITKWVMLSVVICVRQCVPAKSAVPRDSTIVKCLTMFKSTPPLHVQLRLSLYRGLVGLSTPLEA